MNQAAAEFQQLTGHPRTAPQTEDTAPQAGTEGAATPPSRSLPPLEAQALAALESSPRHGEWVDIDLPGSEQPLRTWVVYPERADSAPAVLVIQEIYGMTYWIRGVADQLAADGFIAIAPDLLSGRVRAAAAPSRLAAETPWWRWSGRSHRRKP